MLDHTEISKLKTLCDELQGLQWILKDDKITDESESWVIYQVGFDTLYKKRLELIASVIPILPALLEGFMKPTIDAAVIDPIQKAIAEHEKKFHSK